MDSPRNLGTEALEEALRLFLAYRSDPAGVSEAEFLAGHEDLRGLLEPLLSGSVATALSAGSVAGGLGIDSLQGLHSGDRYSVLERLGEGGMGEVFLADQTEPVRRRVALKIIKLGMGTREVVARFEAEQQALAMMTHPCIARVYEAGSMPDGRPYFAMEYVPGIPITTYCDQHRLDTRERLGLVIEVCGAIQHAHQKGIIHRDIKPSNILVTVQDGRPTPKVIDFGVAKAFDQRLTERSYHTEQGRLIGTPEYMSPEQAELGPLDIDTRSDIYSLGILLYELIVGVLPYRDGIRSLPYTEIQRIVREGEVTRPSTRLARLGDTGARIAGRRGTDARSLERRVRGDLDWIVMKALELDRTRRYASATELAADLQRHLDDEPVIAGPPTASYRVKKFVRKNRLAVVAGGSVAILLVAGLVTTTILLARAERERIRADENRAVADRRYDEVLRLADGKRLRDYVREADALWPAHPDKVDAMERWLNEKALPLAANLPVHEATLATLGAAALPYDEIQRRFDEETHPNAEELEGLLEYRDYLRDRITTLREQNVPESELQYVRSRHEETVSRILELRELVKERRTWAFADKAQQWQYEVLKELVGDLREFVDEDPFVGAIASVRERLAFALSIEERTISGEEAREAWRRASLDVASSEPYGGLQLTPQLGLLPLSPDPDSGLWEFWHVGSGDRPLPNPDPGAPSRWLVGKDTGIVLILVPGGTFWMGAQKVDEDGPNYDPLAEGRESRVHEVTLAPFFISKYEMTQGQWVGFTGSNPSKYAAPDSNVVGVQHITFSNPVEQVTWDQASETLGRMGLVLPTESQWEYAARATTDSPWWTGTEVESLEGAANVMDHFCRVNGGLESWQYEDWLDDGFIVHAPVGSFLPNPFGLHDVIGNVEEWVRDGYVSPYRRLIRPGDGFRPIVHPGSYVTRGGGYHHLAARCRSAVRLNRQRDFLGIDLGFRAARAVED